MTVKAGTWPTAAAVWTVVVLGLAPAAGAQTTAPSVRPGTPEFAQRIDGKKVTVTLADGRDYDGLFAIEGQTLVSHGKKATVTLPVDEIVRVAKNPHRIRLHARIGLAIGAAIGTGVGAILNDINHERDLIYDSNRRTVAWSVAPILSPTRRGAALTIQWR